MVVVITAISEGADVDRLVELTGYPRSFIQGISLRMRSSGIRIDNEVDTRELGEDKSTILYKHASVAMGIVVRREDDAGGFDYVCPQ
jgi:hypothetical protein